MTGLADECCEPVCPCTYGRTDLGSHARSKASSGCSSRCDWISVVRHPSRPDFATTPSCFSPVWPVAGLVRSV